MKVTFLGTGTSLGVPVVGCACPTCTSSDPRNRRTRTSAALSLGGRSVLIDTSPDLRAQALARRIDRVDAVLYTHAHADHVLGLDDLRIYGFRQGEQIPLYGSPQTLESLQRTFWYAFDPNPTVATRPQVRVVPVEGKFDLWGQAVEMIPVYHERALIHGFRLGSFAYVTDASRIPDDSSRRLEGLDVLVLNALRRRPHPAHFTLEQAVDEARRLGARLTYLTHLSDDIEHASIEASLPASVRLAYDGLSFEI
jgi:phosphoribosyl 1,2-cyclic phosphate phosphodiesterase